MLIMHIRYLKKFFKEAEMKIGEFAAACGLPISMLRYYDSCGLRKNQLNEAFRSLDTLQQKISGGTFMTAEKIEPLRENISLPFENDEKVVGKWEILGEYNNRAEFDLDNRMPQSDIGNRNREIYFLPNGESYWCYSWTKGKLLINDGESSYANEYSVERQSDGLYMFVKLKSYVYLHSGRTTLLVLRQLDKKSYNADEIARKDNIDMPICRSQTIKMLSESGKRLDLSKVMRIFRLQMKRRIYSILSKLNFFRTANASAFTVTRLSAEEICRSGRTGTFSANGTKPPAPMK